MTDRWRAVLAIAVALWAAAGTAGVVYLALGLGTDDAVDARAAAWELVGALVVSAGLWVCAHGARRGRRWVRGPLLTWFLIGVPVSLTMSRSALWYLGVPLLAATLVGLGLSVRPATFSADEAY